jgi:dTDP-4-amino-4,6-dideoxygalactose transaminase
MRVERYNYPHQFENAESLFAELTEMIRSGRYILSEEVSRFEKEFAKFVGTARAYGVNTGTDALMIALGALGVGPGSEVITQANTFYATVAAIRHAGATPVLVDADENSFLMDEAQVVSAVTSRTRVILPVHLYGKPTPMAGLMALAQKHGLAVVEDAAQAHGAEISGQRVGSFGDFGCFSFHPSKNLAAAGDGGAITVNSDFLCRRVEQLRALGQRQQNDHVVLGWNSKLDAIQSRILSWKLPHLESANEARRRVADLYRERLTGLPLRFQASTPNERHVYHLFQVRTEHRDQLHSHLVKSGVDAVIRYPTPIHLQPAFRDCGWREGQFPVAERLSRELLCLPIRPDLKAGEVDYVCSCIEDFFMSCGGTRSSREPQNRVADTAGSPILLKAGK